MDKRPAYKEPLSTSLRRHLYGNEEQIAEIIRWVAFSALFTLLAFVITKLINSKYVEALVILTGTLPIIISLVLIRRRMLLLPITIFAVGSILLLTYIATIGVGIYDVAVIGYPVVLIVTSLVLRERSFLI